ncbi:hypothetical protein DXX93_08540 [Thalassotalea euphylliae]|uniref:Uncharacterized protein n=1 Tax=Thalassotalea euphylliae TaxID=1655234 RepID=A0A3E0TQ44_9GAMM|nr:hypothetical protein [Thalassotalea euphylliae]REL26618.1 hypothetical protein DXX93_08540 [Thalassotalea euphylliae]
MTNSYFSPLITIENPDKTPENIKLVARLNDSLNYEDETYSFFTQENYLSIVHHWIATPKNKPSFLTTDQFDAPLEILPWFVDKLEFFRKPSSQGGLPPQKIATDKELVGGENIILGRLMNAGNARQEGGYDICNLDRGDHNEMSSSYARIKFSDSLLFEGGLLDVWKELASKYKNGSL